MTNTNFEKLKKAVSTANQAIKEIGLSSNQISQVRNNDEKKIIRGHISNLKQALKRTNEQVLEELEKINLSQPLQPIEKKPEVPINVPEKKFKPTTLEKRFSKGLSQLEKEAIKRAKKKEVTLTSQDYEKPNQYAKLANKYFYKSAKKLAEDKSFETLKKDLIRTNLEFTPTTYISMILLTTVISSIIAFFIFLFFFLFNVGGEQIISLVTKDLGMKFLKTFWILFAIPMGTFLFMYLYPSLERKSIETRVNQELPFSAIHMAAISESMIEPSKIFSIIITTKEYPYLEREYTKLMNEINVYGYDLVSALRNTALNSPSKKLTDLLNGLATTINSGGDLTDFFNKRAQTLLFEYRIEREKNTKTAETFMDVYISIVIAAPMVLMLLLMMMKVSGLGIALGTSSITLMMVLGVSIINIAFISFLHLRKPAE